MFIFARLRCKFFAMFDRFNVPYIYSMQMAQTMNHFLLYGRAERKYAPETLIKQRDCFSAWLIPMMGDLDVARITRFDVLALREAMERKGLSAARQSSILATLKVFLTFCRTFLKIDCMLSAEIRLPKKEFPNPEVLTPSEVQLVVSCLNPARFVDARLRALCELILGTGVRIGEALRMDREPFDHGITEMDIIGKGGKRRTIFFTERSRYWITTYLQCRVDNHPALFITTGDAPRRCSREDMSKAFASLRIRSSRTKKLTPHILRHTYCTTLRNNGADISLIKELAGHADIQTTARYYLGKDSTVLRKTVQKYVRYDVEPLDEVISPP